MTREELMDSLIDEILVHDINLDTKQMTLKKGNGITTACEYHSIKYLEKYRRIFYVSFHIGEKGFDPCTSKFSPKLSKDKVIRNAEKYFQCADIDFQNMIGSICTDSSEYEKMLLSAIINHLIPAAFDCNLLSKPTAYPRYDDITTEYQKALRAIKIMLLDFRFKRMIQSSDSSFSIVDREYIKPMCNYQLIISRLELGLQYTSFPKWEPVLIVFQPNLHHTIENRRKFLEIMERKTEFERMIEGFLPYPEENAQQAVHLEEPLFGIGSNTFRYPISTVHIHYKSFTVNTFRFITYLDEKTVSEKYPDVHNHNEMKKAIIKKAQQDIKAIYDSMQIENYQNIPRYIDSVLSSMMQIDLCELINMMPNNRDTCYSALKAFNLPAEEIFSLVDDYETPQTDVLLYIYQAIQCALNCFLNNLRFSGVHFAIKATEHLEKRDLTSHVELVRAFLESDNLADVVSIQKK